MTTRLDRIEQLFHAALEREPEERALFLHETCAEDPTMKTEVESLIQVHEGAGSFLEAPVYEVAAGLLEDADPHALVGQSLDHYEIVALIGRGGMGAVYLARDTHLDRKVALKLLPPHCTSDERRLRRFIQEAKTASSL